MAHVDYFSVFVGALIFMIISSAWYSPFLFGNLWKKYVQKEIRKKTFAFTATFFVAVILSYFLSLVEIYFGATSFWDGVISGFIIYIGFVFPTQIISVIWCKETFKIFLIDNFCYLLSLMVMGGVLVG